MFKAMFFHIILHSLWLKASGQMITGSLCCWSIHLQKGKKSFISTWSIWFNVAEFHYWNCNPLWDCLSLSLLVSPRCWCVCWVILELLCGMSFTPCKFHFSRHFCYRYCPCIIHLNTMPISFACLHSLAQCSHNLPHSYIFHRNVLLQSTEEWWTSI